QKLKNPFPDRPDYQPNRAPKRPHATVNKFRILSCRKEEPYLSHGMNVSTFLVHVIRAGLEFRPDPVAGDPSIVDVLPLARMNLKANHLVGGQILRQRRDFG